MGILVANQIDLNDVNVVNRLRLTIQNLINNPSRYYPLRFKPSYYFEIPNASLPPTKGWYIILDGTVPIYAGKADDLNARLNTNNGSIDNFANKTRASDPKRNFIKKFDELNILKELRVCIIQERELFSELVLDPTDLTDLDRTNIEKLIDIFKCYFSYK